ncbi:hypothetical protein BSLG_006632 [Batrachochytrium salamandrivorans]|nr:hypothetical protein BASA60_008958 [Batrachochytrium salamandrivorans]KAJ1336867.1 hypothetical protein BSLG_006632 [Batrachochytrium salamandrivorans]
MTTAQALHEAASAVYSHLSLTPISQVLRHMHRSRGIKPLISVHEDTELGLSLTIMRNANILAIPVYRIPKAEPTGKVFTGIVSVFDILANTVFQQVFDSMCVDKSQPPLMERDEFQRYTKIMEEEKAFFTTKIGDLVGKTRESSESWILHSYDPLSSLLQILTCDNRHRALIVDDEAISASASNTDDGYGPTAPPSGSFIRLITQTDLVRYLLDTESVLFTEKSQRQTDSILLKKALDTIWKLQAHNVGQIATARTPGVLSEGDQPITPISICQPKPIVSIQSDSSALEGFRTLYIHRVPAVAVVEDTGRLVANLSASDVRGIHSSNLEMFLLPVFDFLESGKRVAGQVKPDQLKTVEPTSLIGAAAASMIVDIIHRMWVVDGEDHPIGVLSMSDILSVFVPEDGAAIQQ